ncbi:hypothetical protein Tco_0269326 [Tanacetum coccineum]
MLSESLPHLISPVPDNDSLMEDIDLFHADDRIKIPQDCPDCEDSQFVIHQDDLSPSSLHLGIRYPNISTNAFIFWHTL